jgi:hypothetical protein
MPQDVALLAFNFAVLFWKVQLEIKTLEEAWMLAPPPVFAALSINWDLSTCGRIKQDACN